MNLLLPDIQQHLLQETANQQILGGKKASYMDHTVHKNHRSMEQKASEKIHIIHLFLVYHMYSCLVALAIIAEKQHHFQYHTPSVERVDR